MKYKRMSAILAAAAIGCSLAGCKAPKLPGQTDAPADTSVEAPADPQAANTVTGKVASIDGTKIKIELGELVARSSGGNKPGSNDGNDSGDKKRPDRKDRKDGDKEFPSDWTKPDGDKGNFPGGGSRGYTFKGTSKTAEYDLSGLKEITLENDDDDTPDTVSEIKSGDVVVITLGADGTPSALTVKNMSPKARPSGGKSGDDGRDGKDRGDRDGKGRNTGSKNKDRGNGNREKRGKKTDETEEAV